MQQENMTALGDLKEVVVVENVVGKLSKK